MHKSKRVKIIKPEINIKGRGEKPCVKRQKHGRKEEFGKGLKDLAMDSSK